MGLSLLRLALGLEQLVRPLVLGRKLETLIRFRAQGFRFRQQQPARGGDSFVFVHAEKFGRHKVGSVFVHATGHDLHAAQRFVVRQSGDDKRKAFFLFVVGHVRAARLVHFQPGLQHLDAA